MLRYSSRGGYSERALWEEGTVIHTLDLCLFSSTAEIVVCTVYQFGACLVVLRRLLFVQYTGSVLV